MDIEKVLFEYGILNKKMNKINERIEYLIDLCRDIERNIQIFRYFDYNKTSEKELSIDQWADEVSEDIYDDTYELLDLIKEKKKLKRKIYYRKSLIIKYSINLSE